MTFQQLSYVVEIAKCGSINKAAGKLFLSQSGISAAIKELEDELGITIYSRSSKGVALTPEGREFLGYAASLLEQKDRITGLYTNKGENSEAPIQHFSVSSQRYPFTEAAFLKMVQSAPKTRYRYSDKETTLDGVIDDVYDHRADVGVIFITEMTEKIIMHLLSARNLSFNLIAEVAPCIYLRKGHPLLKEKKMTEEMLSSYPYVSFEQNQSVSADFAEEYPLFRHVKANRGITVNSRSTATNIIRFTDAYTTGSGLFARDLIIPDVITVPLEDMAPIKLGWIHIRGTRLPQNAELFVELLEDAVRDSIEFTTKLREDYFREQDSRKMP